MLKIRLQRIGRINMPSYRLIVVEHTEGPRTGKFTEIVGTYDPRRKDRKLNDERIKYWISVGAQPSDTVHNMLVSAGIIEGKKINVLPRYKAPAEAAAEEKAEAVEKAAEQEAKAEAKAEHDAAVAAEAEAKAEEPKPEPGEAAAEAVAPEEKPARPGKEETPTT